MLLRPVGISLFMAGALALTGCGSVPGASPPAIGGVPPEAPPRASVQPAYPHIYDQPPARPARLITEEEQARLQAELTALRRKVNRQADTLEKER